MNCEVNMKMCDPRHSQVIFQKCYSIQDDCKGKATSARFGLVSLFTWCGESPWTTLKCNISVNSE